MISQALDNIKPSTGEWQHSSSLMASLTFPRISVVLSGQLL